MEDVVAQRVAVTRVIQPENVTVKFPLVGEDKVVVRVLKNDQLVNVVRDNGISGTPEVGKRFVGVVRYSVVEEPDPAYVPPPVPPEV